MYRRFKRKYYKARKRYAKAYAKVNRRASGLMAYAARRYLKAKRVLPPPNYHDLEVTSDLDHSSFSLVKLNTGIANSEFPRGKLGYNIYMKNILIYLTNNVYYSSTGVKIARTDPETVQCRVMLVYDKQSNGEEMNLAYFLNEGGTTYGQVFGLRELGNSQRFEVIMDKWYNLNTSYQFARNTKYYVPLNNRPVRYQDEGGTGDIATIYSGALYLLIGTVATKADSNISCGSYVLNARLRYTT